jgi:hypothetical protein
MTAFLGYLARKEVIMRHPLATLCLSLLMSMGLAQAATKAKDPPERSAKSLECSKQADANGLHGKERHKFRSKCKKEKG